MILLFLQTISIYISLQEVLIPVFQKRKKATCPRGGQLIGDRIVDPSILQRAFTIDNIPVFNHMQLEMFISHSQELADFYK